MDADPYEGSVVRTLQTHPKLPWEPIANFQDLYKAETDNEIYYAGNGINNITLKKIPPLGLKMLDIDVTQNKNIKHILTCIRGTQSGRIYALEQRNINLKKHLQTISKKEKQNIMQKLENKIGLLQAEYRKSYARGEHESYEAQIRKLKNLKADFSTCTLRFHQQALRKQK